MVLLVPDRSESSKDPATRVEMAPGSAASGGGRGPNQIGQRRMPHRDSGAQLEQRGAPRRKQQARSWKPIESNRVALRRRRRPKPNWARNSSPHTQFEHQSRPRQHESGRTWWWSGGGDGGGFEAGERRIFPNLGIPYPPPFRKQFLPHGRTSTDCKRLCRGSRKRGTRGKEGAQPGQPASKDFSCARDEMEERKRGGRE